MVAVKKIIIVLFYYIYIIDKLHIQNQVACDWERQAAPIEWDVFFLGDVIFRKSDRGWAIEVAVGDDTTNEHTGDDDSKISPGDGAQCQKIWCGCFAPDTPPREDDR